MSRHEPTGDQRPGGFGQLLRRYRTSAGLIQEELAERAELTPRGIAYPGVRGAFAAPHHDQPARGCIRTDISA